MRLPKDYLERVYAGWLGKVMGVRHGAPVEGWSQADIERLFPEDDGFLTDVDIFEPDDDINGPLFFIRALEDEKAGEDIRPMETALAWINYAPYEHGFFWWPGYGKPTPYHLIEKGETALRHAHESPSEGLGARIFSDTWGLVAPGNPALAAKLMRTALLADTAPGGAGEDAAVLQVVLISLAFCEHTLESLLEKALAFIPEGGDVACMARDVLACFRENPVDSHRTRRHIHENWAGPRFPGMFHAVSNTAYILYGLLYSNGELKRGLSLCTRCGLDTDCNSGNLGAILGVFSGLKGFDAAMRRKMNDIALCSSVLGEQNIGDIPTQAKYIALRGYRLHGLEGPGEIVQSLKDPVYLDFSLPGATHGLRALGHGDTVLGAVPGGVRVFCRAADARTGMRVYHQTYYRPQAVHNNRYDPCFSPKCYPGQTVTATVRQDECCQGDIGAAVFVYDGNSGTYYEGPVVRINKETNTVLHFQIPRLTGALIENIGIRFTLYQACEGGLTALIRHLSVQGSPDYEMDFRKERMEHWSFVQQECSQFTYSRGRWYYQGVQLLGQVASHGEMFTGARSFTDVAVHCTVTPYTPWGARVLARVQGAFRYYAAALTQDGIALIRQNHGETVLASVKFSWQVNEPVRLGMEVQGDMLRVLADGKAVLAARDDAFSSGSVGIGLSGDCARGAFEALEVQGL